MLPGLRILFAITLLSVSVLIFGLGAAAFLRSAHENFASASYKPIEAPVTARVDLAPATIAMLRVEPETTPASALLSKTDLPKIDLPAQLSTPVETPVPLNLPTAEPVAVDPTRAERTEAPIAVAPFVVTPIVSPPAPPEPASAPQVNVPDDPPVVASKPLEAPAAESPAIATTRAVDTKITEPKEPGAPTVVAALNPDKTEQPAKSVPPSPPVATAPSSVAETLASIAGPVRGADTLKADDKTIDAAPVTTIAALGEPALAEFAPLPTKDVRIPHPRVDPAVIEAQRRQLIAQKRARARAVQARRVAAARARAATQAKPTSDPFGTPANNATRTN